MNCQHLLDFSTNRLKSNRGFTGKQECCHFSLNTLIVQLLLLRVVVYPCCCCYAATFLLLLLCFATMVFNLLLMVWQSRRVP